MPGRRERRGRHRGDRPAQLIFARHLTSVCSAFPLNTPSGRATTLLAFDARGPSPTMRVKRLATACTGRGDPLDYVLLICKFSRTARQSGGCLRRPRHAMGPARRPIGTWLTAVAELSCRAGNRAARGRDSHNRMAVTCRPILPTAGRFRGFACHSFLSRPSRRTRHEAESNARFPMRRRIVLG